MGGKVLPKKVNELKKAIAVRLGDADQIISSQGILGATQVIDAVNLARREVRIFQRANRLNQSDSAQYLDPIRQSIDTYELSVVQGVAK